MSVNLANVYAALLRKYDQKYAVIYGPPPTYLCNITSDNRDNKIIFVYKEDLAKPIEYGTPFKFKIRNESPENKDLIGSPLKDDCMVDAIDEELLNNEFKTAAMLPWKAEEEGHRGIKVDTARSILCAEDFQIGEDVDAETRGSVWVLCNGQDTERTLLLQYEHLPSTFSRGLITFLGIMLPQSINVHTMLQQHNKLGVRLDTSIENIYKFKNNIAIRCAWSTGAAVPSLIDLSICDVTLMQTVRLSECNYLTQSFVNQLQILSLLRDDIMAHKKATGEVVTEPVYRCGRGIDMEDLRDNISKAITEIAAPTPLDEANGIDSDLETVLQGARPLTDLTDKMWEILKCCANYKNLKMAFNYLFQCAARCNVVNMPRNKNRLAEIITEVANGRLAIPCLTGTEPLELLLEIGLDKLQKDYEFVFNESKVCKTSLLQHKSLENMDKENDGDKVNVRKSLRNAVRPEIATSTRKTLLKTNTKQSSEEIEDDTFLAGFKNSNFDERETASRLAKLLQIHFTLEHLLLMHTQLNLSGVSRAVCEHLLNKPAPFVTNIDESLFNDMEITLAVHDVREHLEGKDPHTRRICMKSKNKFRELQSIFYYSMDKICPPGIIDAFITDEKEMVMDNIYYSWFYRKIKTFH